MTSNAFFSSVRLGVLSAAVAAIATLAACSSTGGPSGINTTITMK